jgi:hypothetical protein
MPRGHPPGVRRKVLALIESGRKAAEAARLLGISDQTVDTRRRRHRIDTGQEPGITGSDHAEPIAARRRIAELEAEPAGHRRAAGPGGAPQGRFGATAGMAGERLPVRPAARVPPVAESGSHARRSRPPSARSPRHLRPTEAITGIHTASRGHRRRPPRVRRAAPRFGPARRPRHRRAPQAPVRPARPPTATPRPASPSAADPVDRNLTRTARDRLQVTDLTEPPPGRARSTAPPSSTSTRAEASAGLSTPPGPLPRPTTPRAGPSATDGRGRAARSSTPTTGPGSAPGPSPNATAPTMPRWNPSGAESTPNRSTGDGGAPAWNPASRLHETRGTSEPPPDPERFNLR